MAELTRSQIVICNSLDRQSWSSNGAGNDFTQSFNTALLHGVDQTEYEVALLDIELSGVPTSDVLVYTNCVTESPIGSEHRRIIRVISLAEFSGTNHWRAGSMLEYKPLGIQPPIMSISFTLADWNAKLIPTKETRITLCFRRAGNLF